MRFIRRSLHFSVGGGAFALRLCFYTLPPIPSLRAIFWRGNLAVGGKGMPLLSPSTLGGEGSRMRGSVIFAPICHSGLDPESHFCYSCYVD